MVLSNNDGCVIARSNEAKALGIAMGEPWHICKKRVPTDGVIVRSSNYTLYGDMSARVMQVVAGFTADLEIYSIDEAFLGLGGIRPVWTQHSVRPTPAVTVNGMRLGEFITSMVDGRIPGIGRLCTPSLKTDWSMTVEKLLEVTYGRSFHHKPTLGPAAANRGVRAPLALSYQVVAGLLGKFWVGADGEPPSDVEETVKTADHPMGISVLYVTLDDGAGD